MAGALTRETYLEETIVIRCGERVHEGCYRRKTPAECFVPAEPLPDVLNALTRGCARCSLETDRQCRRAVFSDPLTDKPWRR